MTAWEAIFGGDPTVTPWESLDALGGELAALQSAGLLEDGAVRAELLELFGHFLPLGLQGQVCGECGGAFVEGEPAYCGECYWAERQVADSLSGVVIGVEDDDDI